MRGRWRVGRLRQDARLSAHPVFRPHGSTEFAVPGDQSSPADEAGGPAASLDDLGRASRKGETHASSALLVGDAEHAEGTAAA